MCIRHAKLIFINLSNPYNLCIVIPTFYRQELSEVTQYMCSGHSISQAASQYRGLYSLDHAFTYIIEFSTLGITDYYCLCFTEDNTEM